MCQHQTCRGWWWGGVGCQHLTCRGWWWGWGGVYQHQTCRGVVVGVECQHFRLDGGGGTPPPLPMCQFQ